MIFDNDDDDDDENGDGGDEQNNFNLMILVDCRSGNEYVIM